MGRGVFYLDYLNESLAPFGIYLVPTREARQADLIVADLWGKERFNHKAKLTMQGGWESWVQHEFERDQGRRNIVYFSSIFHPNHFYLPVHVLYEGFDFYERYLLNPSKISRVAALDRKFCLCIVSNTVENFRYHFIEALCEYRHVDCYGLLFRNASHPVADDCLWFDPRMADLVSQYKFIVVMENKSQPGYHTEKLFHGFRADTLPIYWGDPYLPQLYDTGSFLYVYPDESVERAVKRVIDLDQNDELYLATLRHPRVTAKLRNSPFTRERHFGQRLAELFGRLPHQEASESSVG